LKIENDIPFRLISSAHLSRPEHYFSIYQSGCNMDCLKCHSWNFSQHVDRGGEWLSPDDILAEAEAYAAAVTYNEPVSRATSFHAQDLCRSCGACVQPAAFDPYGNSRTLNDEGNIFLVPTGRKGPMCPGKVAPGAIMLSPQGFGPARNIIAFTGGDLGCKPGYYADCAKKIKAKDLSLHLLFETNGFGLTDQNLDTLKLAGFDAFWLDIKAFDPTVHKKLTGVPNERILKLPEEMIKRGFTLEVLTLFIPGWVEHDQIAKIAETVCAVDEDIPFTILAFFPEYQLKHASRPTLEQMITAYERVKETGLQHVRLANIGVFVSNNREMEILMDKAPEAV
jgi:pyruvate-formate lyase-activating enzyme